jgi:ribosomal subunit interface protein
VDIVVKGRNVEVPDHFRVFVAEKLARSERYDPKIIRVDVELSHETNRRQHKTCQRVQITVASRGPAVRAEASAENFYAALDAAVTKVETRLHRLHDRRRDRQHGRTPITAVAASPEEILGAEEPSANGAVRTAVLEDEPRSVGADESGSDADRWVAEDGGPGRIVRIKDHPADPITVDEALLQMELVGHDFYLFNDSEAGVASVVYRRHGFDYGLLRLK